MSSPAHLFWRAADERLANFPPGTTQYKKFAYPFARVNAIAETAAGSILLGILFGAKRDIPDEYRARVLSAFVTEDTLSTIRTGGANATYRDAITGLYMCHEVKVQTGLSDAAIAEIGLELHDPPGQAYINIESDLGRYALQVHAVLYQDGA